MSDGQKVFFHKRKYTEDIESSKQALKILKTAHGNVMDAMGRNALYLFHWEKIGEGKIVWVRDEQWACVCQLADELAAAKRDTDEYTSAVNRILFLQDCYDVTPISALDYLKNVNDTCVVFYHRKVEN